MKLETHRNYKWFLVALLWLVACLNYTDRMMIFTIFPLLKKEMGLSDIMLALLGSSFLWAYGACSPVGGYLGDRLSRKRVILWSLVLFSVVTFATGLAHSGRQLIALRVFLGVSEALFLPTALAHIASFHGASTRSLANGITLTGLTAGVGLGSFYGGYMTDHYSWRAGFYFLGLAGILLSLLLMPLLRDHAPTAKSTCSKPPGDRPHEQLNRKLAAILKTPTVACLIFLAFALSVTSWPIATWVPTYLFEKFGMSLTRAGFSVGFFLAIPALIGGVLGGWLADRWSEHDPRGRMGMQIIGLFIMGPTMLAMGFISSGTNFSNDLLVYSLARGVLEANSMPLFVCVVAPNRWSTAYGIYNLAGTLAGSLGVLFVGVTKSAWGIGYALSSMSAFLFIATGVMTFALFQFLLKDMRELPARSLAAVNEETMP